MSAPKVSPSLLAMADQAEAELRDYLQDYPALVADLRENPRSQQIAQSVSVDVLACLSEVWREPVETRLNVVCARLLAWQRLSDSGAR